MGAIFTCPLEVVKTRLQSSNSGFIKPESSGPSAPSKPSAPISGMSLTKKHQIIDHKKLYLIFLLFSTGTAIRKVTLPPDMAVLDRRGALQITVPVANAHSRASVSPSMISISRPCSTSTVPTKPPPSMNVFQCLK